METLEGLKRQINSTKELQSVVKTMKSLAAVNIRQYEQAAEALAEYNRTVETGLQVVLRQGGKARISARPAAKTPVGAVIFGSDQGMCGALNERIMDHAQKALDDLAVAESERFLLLVGERVQVLGEDMASAERFGLNVPSSVSGIRPLVQEILLHILDWNLKSGIAQVYLFYNRQTSAAAYRPRTVHILPTDQSWLDRLRQKPWESRCLPLFQGSPEATFSALIREYLFVSLFRAMTDSLASENASRLAAMQGAEKSISEKLAELTGRFHQQRQMSITEELLDIVAGFEALAQKG